MSSQFIRGLAAGGFLLALSLTLPSETRAQRSGVELWEASCGRCHVIQPTNKYEAKDWRSIGTHMGIYARLTSAQREAVIAFLVSGARTDQTAQAPTSISPATGGNAHSAASDPEREASRSTRSTKNVTTLAESRRLETRSVDGPR